MLPALGLSTITAGYGLLKALQARSAAAARTPQETGQKVPAGSGRPAGFDVASLSLAQVFDGTGADAKGAPANSGAPAGGFAPSQDPRMLAALLSLQEDRPAEASTATAGTDAASGSADTLFDRIDANKDGAIDKSELAAAFASAKGRHHAHHASARSGQGGSPLDALFASIDGNGDTTISADELSAALSRAAQARDQAAPAAFAAAAARYAKVAAAPT